MAVYTHVDDAALADFLTDYDLPAADGLEAIVAGVENTNYFLNAGTERYILTLYERRVRPEDVPYFLNLMRFLSDKGLSVPQPVRRNDDGLYGALCNRSAAILSFLPGKAVMDPSPAHAEAAGRALAELHKTGGLFPEKRENDLGPEGWASLGRRVRGMLAAGGIGVRKPEIEEAIALADRLVQEWPTTLPSGTVHGDFFPDNVFFEPETASPAVAGIIDFYFACTDSYAYDLAIAMNAWTCEEKPDYAVPHAMLSGYEQVRPLTEQERAALPTLLTGAALRFWLTRAFDVLEQVPGSLVKVKDPKPWWHLVQNHLKRPDLMTGAVK